MKCKITLQERLKDLRVAHNLNLEELAKLTGISKSALGNYENDDYWSYVKKKYKLNTTNFLFLCNC